MAFDVSNIDHFRLQFKVTEEDFNRQVTDTHLQSLSMVNGIDRESWETVSRSILGTKDPFFCVPPTEEGRLNILNRWKRENPLQATYKELCNHLLNCGCTDAAVIVVRGLKDEIKNEGMVQYVS